MVIWKWTKVEPTSGKSQEEHYVITGFGRGDVDLTMNKLMLMKLVTQKKEN